MNRQFGREGKGKRQDKEKDEKRRATDKNNITIASTSLTPNGLYETILATSAISEFAPWIFHQETSDPVDSPMQFATVRAAVKGALTKTASLISRLATRLAAALIRHPE